MSFLSGRRVLTLSLVSALFLGLLGAAGVAGYVRFVRGVPLIDEWYCSDGEGPVDLTGGGSYCAELGATLDEGEEWDPLGNRPFSCDGRWGWTVITDGEDGDCLRDGLPLPAGWRLG